MRKTCPDWLGLISSNIAEGIILSLYQMPSFTFSSISVAQKNKKNGNQLFRVKCTRFASQPRRPYQYAVQPHILMDSGLHLPPPSCSQGYRFRRSSHKTMPLGKEKQAMHYSMLIQGSPHNSTFEWINPY